MTKLRYLTKDKLISLAIQAKRTNKNRQLVVSELEKLLDNKFPITQHFIHNDNEVRCKVILNETAKSCQLDIDIGIFNKLPTFIISP